MYLIVYLFIDLFYFIDLFSTEAPTHHMFCFINVKWFPLVILSKSKIKSHVQFILQLILFFKRNRAIWQSNK